jgi:hypothetical protein
LLQTRECGAGNRVSGRLFEKGCGFGERERRPARIGHQQLFYAFNMA